MTKKDKEEILDLFFEKIKSINYIENIFNGKYSRFEIKREIWNKINEGEKYDKQ